MKTEQEYRLFRVEDKTEKYINEYLSEGWRIHSQSVSIAKESIYTITYVSVVFEREVQG